jgi:endogenous inhibitor of DNA gyrase (YacG/DUF329 family)
MTTKTHVASKLRKRKPCPICGKPSTEEAAPFCSRRCADIDLGRWLKGVYAIPARPADEDHEDSERERPPALAPRRS